SSTTKHVSNLFINSLALTNDVTQPDPMVVTHSGRSVSLTCFCPSEMIMNVLWLKQTFGQKPLLMASSYHYSQESSYFNKFIKDFNKTKRLSVKRAEDSFNLTISKTEPGDSATYYCAALIVNEIRIAEGTVLYVKGSESNSMSVLQQPVSESVQPGDSVTLNCTINTGTCEGEHSVYWFRHDSGDSLPEIIYTNGDRSGQCMKSPESGSPTQSCVYNLPKRNLSLSDTGTYYCAVTSCGEILFGNGTKLNVQIPGHYYPFDLSPTVLVLILSNIFLSMKHPKLNYNIIIMHFVMSPPLQNQNSDVLNYAAVRFNPKKSSSARRVKDKTVRKDAVYSEVRYLQQE
uniref:Ig-like domain-containing protein n=1 Tax=Esox lucius TaxID=8010 RepID=A0A3P9AHV2_ESOLU